MITMLIDGVEYELATTLRVAFKIQGQHNHKPYAEIFQQVGTMPLEQQIGMLYAAYEVANPTAPMLRPAFQNYMLDNYNLKDLMDVLQGVIAGMMGTTVEDMQAKGKATDEQDPPTR